MRFNPGKWSDPIFEQLRGGQTRVENTFQDHGPEVAVAVLLEAQKWVSKFTVAIGPSRISQGSVDIDEITPGSGVIVRLHNNTYAILTAAHVLRRGNNTPDNVEVTVLVPSSNREQGGDTLAINLQPRSCTIDGFRNETEEGPDIAMIPLLDREWRTLDAWGMVAYNLDKQRWSDKDIAAISEANSWCLSVINGVRCIASKIVYEHTDKERGSLVIMATNTKVDVARKRNEHDYLELPSETTEFSFPTHWERELPGTSIEEIDELHKEGVTQRVWGGTSGAGVWNLAVGTNQDAMPAGGVWVELAGICFFANPEKGCVIAHGTKSIRAIADRHIEKEALRYHTKSGKPA